MGLAPTAIVAPGLIFFVFLPMDRILAPAPTKLEPSSGRSEGMVIDIAR